MSLLEGMKDNNMWFEEPDWKMLARTEQHLRAMVIHLEHYMICKKLTSDQRIELVNIAEAAANNLSQLWKTADVTYPYEYCCCPCHMGMKATETHKCCNYPRKQGMAPPC